MPPLLRMSGISKRYPGVVANDGIDLEVQRGEILGLLGENGAGKTTLMNILYGLTRPDEGHIEIDGQPVSLHSPRDAVERGIGMVHQHFMLVPDMTVAENVALGLRSGRLPLARLSDVAARLSELSQRYGLRVEPSALVEDLSVGLKQRVEILKLLYRGARILILDEPSAVLTPVEWQGLARILRSLADDGCGVILITHKLDELLGVADRCTVLRRGRVVGSVAIADADRATLARMMVGRDVVLRVPRQRLEPGRPVLEVRDLSLVDANGRARLAGLSFAVREREVLGVAGVDGNGQSELVAVLTGLLRPTSGQLWLDGARVASLSPTEFARRSGAVIPEDRHGSGLALDMTVLENLLMKEIGAQPFSRWGFLARAVGRQHGQRLVVDYDIRTPGLGVRVGQLSGGNQQKLVLARELSRRPRLLIAAQPTRGLDVGATEFVHRRILAHRASGGATLLVSTELDEILALSDRIAVMVSGRWLGISDAENVDVGALGLLMTGDRTPAPAAVPIA